MKRVLTISLLVALLGALTANVAAAHKGGPHHGNTYAKNFYPEWYFKYCEPDGRYYYGKVKAAERCETAYTRYREKWSGGKKYYYVLVNFDWSMPPVDQPSQPSTDVYRWYYCQHHKYDDPNSKRPRFQCQLTKSKRHYWERFDRAAPKPPASPEDRTPPHTWITDYPQRFVPRGQPVTYKFQSTEAGSRFECRAWGLEEDEQWHEPPWEPCSSPYTYIPKGPHNQWFRVRAIDQAGNADPTPERDNFYLTAAN